VRNGKTCVSCGPSRVGKWQNIASESSSQTMDVDSTSQISNVDKSNDDCRIPDFVRALDPSFQWSESVSGEAFSTAIRAAYEEIVRWKRNIFMLPSGKIGERFVLEMARLFKSFGESTPLESIALKAAMVLPQLLLQKPSRNSRVKDHIKCLQRRMSLWDDGDIQALVVEGRAIQQRLRQQQHTDEADRITKSFARLMKQGKVKSALRLLAKVQGAPLSIHDPAGEDKTVLDVLRKKHPTGQDVNSESIVQDSGTMQFHSVIFESLDCEAIRKAAMKTDGSAGPSGVDARGFRRMCTSFGRASDELCWSMSCVARRIASTYVDPSTLVSFTACRLIALDKHPGVRPIGVGEVARRIISKAILSVIERDIKAASENIQLCVGQTSGCEAGVHAMRRIFQEEDTDAILLVDATNAFNALNRKAALINIHALCPSLAVVATNMYRNAADMHIEGEIIQSSEGTTQGDPLSMSIYGIAILPLISHLDGLCRQLWFADDASAGGRVEFLREWWRKLKELGPAYGYHPNPSKTWLLVKEQCLEKAKDIFNGYGINITSAGHRHLGSVLGGDEFLEAFVKAKISTFADELEQLCKIAKTEPQAAYSALTHGAISKWTYLMRTTPGIAPLMTPLEHILRNKFIPIITGRDAVTDEERRLLALPCHNGGLGIINPTCIADQQFDASIDVTQPLIELILEQKFQYSEDVEFEQIQRKSSLKRSRREQSKDEMLSMSLSDNLRRSVELAAEKGSSTWLTALPIEDQGFAMHKGEFQDALCLRYGWLPHRLPGKCECGSSFSVDHALNCPKGAFPTIRHNELRDLTGNLLAEVCPDVCIEPVLQTLGGETFNHLSANQEDHARSDIRARGFWGSTHQCAFFDIKVFNPNAQTYRRSSLESCYKREEKKKKRAYEQRILDVEHGTFTPLVFSTSGGMGRLARTFYARLAHLLSIKRQTRYAATMGLIRCKISFSLMRAAIMCLRGARSSANHASRACDSIHLAVTEGHLTY